MFDFCSFPCKGRKDSLEIYKPSYNKNETYPNSHLSEVSLVKGVLLIWDTSYPESYYFRTP